MAVDYPEPSRLRRRLRTPAATISRRYGAGLGPARWLRLQPAAAARARRRSCSSEAEIEVAGGKQGRRPAGTAARRDARRGRPHHAEGLPGTASGRVDLTQFGFEPAKEIAAESLLSPKQLAAYSGEAYEEADKISAVARDEVAAALAAKDIRVDWMTPTGDFEATQLRLHPARTASRRSCRAR